MTTENIGEREIGIESGIDSGTRHDEMIGETVAMAAGAPVVGAVREFEVHQEADGALSHASFSLSRSPHASSLSSPHSCLCSILIVIYNYLQCHAPVHVLRV